MTKIISLFNHKGRVSKTTTTFHLGWVLANLGQKVLIVDADAQCNLTGLALGIHEHDTLFDFYGTRGNYDIYNSLATAFGFETELVDASKEGIPKLQKTNNSDMSLLPGHVDFAKFDPEIATAMTVGKALPLLEPLLGSVNNLIRKTADRGNFDVVLIDMSPNISATNTCIFMASDYFIIPTSPDFFCYQSIQSLSYILPEWCEKLERFKDGSTLPKSNPKMLGIISQNYRVYNASKEDEGNEKTNKEMANEFKKWSDKIKRITNEKLVKSLQKKEINMIVDEDLFKKHVRYDEPYNLANIQNFNSLIPISQKLAKPMFELTKKDGKWSGVRWDKDEKGNKTGVKYDIEKAKDVYLNLGKSVAGMIGLDVKK